MSSPRLLLVSLALFSAGSVPAQQPTAWFQVSPNAAPGYAVSYVRLAYDQQRGVIVLVGSGGILWEWDGATWTNRNPTTRPPFADSCDVVYDSARKVCVGVFSVGVSLETWEWNGSTWTMRPVSVPSYRRYFSMAYDSVRGRTVMFGGSDRYNAGVTDTWEYDGNGWTQKSAGGPSPRAWPAMTFDAGRGQTVIFGGTPAVGVNVFLADTWTWTGSAWVEHFGVSGPAGRAKAAFSYDPVRDRCVLFGGANSGAGGLADTTTWEWNGTSWQALTTGQPPAMSILAMAFDPVRNQHVLYGVAGPTTTPQAQHWARYAFQDPQARWTAFGSGCAGTVGIPALNVAPGSLPWLGAVFVVNVTNLPASTLRVPFGLLGASKTAWQGLPLPVDLGLIGMPGCLLHVGMDLTFPLSAPTGSTTWTVTLPSNPTLVGSTLYQQIAVLDPGANQLGVSMSNAGEAYVGFK